MALKDLVALEVLVVLPVLAFLHFYIIDRKNEVFGWVMLLVVYPIIFFYLPAMKEERDTDWEVGLNKNKFVM